MTSNIDPKSRQEFETWFSNGGEYTPAIERSGDSYKYSTAHLAWMAWQAGWRAAKDAS